MFSAFISAESFHCFWHVDHFLNEIYLIKYYLFNYLIFN
jgi:hypothetical protein